MGGLLGVGGGFVMVPLLVLWARFDEHQAHGTSLAVMVPIALAATLIYYFGVGPPAVDLRVGGFLIAGSIVGAYVGGRLSDRVPERWLTLGMAVLLAAIGLKEVVLP